jgi:hypothetical protein
MRNSFGFLPELGLLLLLLFRIDFVVLVATQHVQFRFDVDSFETVLRETLRFLQLVTAAPPLDCCLSPQSKKIHREPPK